MSDFFIAVVPIGVSRDEVKNLSAKVVGWLIEKEIVAGTETDCVLGGERGLGYAPGAKYKYVVDGDDYTHDLLSLATNGVEIGTQRTVFHNGGNGLDKVGCPACGANNLDTDWGDAVDAWYTNHPDTFSCNQCGKESPVTEYKFEPTWAFGEFGVTFWNWPSLKAGFLEELKQITQKDIKVVYGRL